MTYTEITYSTAIANGMPPNLAALITAQAAHETAVNDVPFSSNVFLHCKNGFGYKYVGQSLATSCLSSPEGDTYAGYASYDLSVVEICRWIKRRQNEGVFPADLTTIVSADQYAQLLKNAGYYGDTVSNYTSGLVYWLGKIANAIPTPVVGGLGILLLIGLGLLVIHKRKNL